jgi:hypothetical protein
MNSAKAYAGHPEELMEMPLRNNGKFMKNL